MSFSRYLLGFAALVVCLGSLGLTATLVRARLLPQWRGPEALLVESVIALALLIGLLELVGLLGWFRLGVIVGSSAAVAVLASTALGRRWSGTAAPPAMRHGALARAIGVLAAGVVFAEWAVPTFHSYDVGIRAFDSLWYHLPWAATFAQTGHVTPLHFTDVEYLTAFYPASAELLHGWGIALFGNDLLSPGINLVFLGLALLAAWCIGSPRGLGAATLTGGALALSVPMMRFSQAGSAANDVVGVFFLLAAAALLMRARDGAPRTVWMLAGISAGLAVSVKLSLLAPVAAMTIGALVIAPERERWRVGGWWLLPLVLAGGFWYIRNLVAVGNPLPWVDVGVLATPADPLQAHTGFSVAHYLFDGHVWSRYLRPGLSAGLGPAWPALLAAAIIGPLVCVVRGTGRTPRVLGAVAIAAWVGYLLTPEGAAGPAGRPLGFAFNLRYAAPALALSLAVLPLGAERVGAGRAERGRADGPAERGRADGPAERGRAEARHVVLGGLAILLILTITESRLWPAAYTESGALVGVLVAGAVWVWRRATMSRPIIMATGGALLVAGGALGYAGERHYLRGRYVYEPGVSSLATLWQSFRRIHHARVALAGTFGGFFSYPLFGLDDSNRVQYVARRGPHGSFTPIRGCREWRRSINEGRFRYVVSTPARDPWRPRTLSPSPEGAWTASDPAARKVFSSRAVGQEIAVYELRAALDPSACPASSS